MVVLDGYSDHIGKNKAGGGAFAESVSKNGRLISAFDDLVEDMSVGGGRGGERKEVASGSRGRVSGRQRMKNRSVALLFCAGLLQ